jgi:hypothetical protein
LIHSWGEWEVASDGSDKRWSIRRAQLNVGGTPAIPVITRRGSPIVAFADYGIRIAVQM